MRVISSVGAPRPEWHLHLKLSFAGSETYYGDLAKVRISGLNEAEAARQAEAARKRSETDAHAKLEAERGLGLCHAPTP
jgi:hypothetical protein